LQRLSLLQVCFSESRHEKVQKTKYICRLVSNILWQMTSTHATRSNDDGMTRFVLSDEQDTDSASDSDASSLQGSSRTPHHAAKARQRATNVAHQLQHEALDQNATHKTHSTVPLWFGCAVLCTVLVGIVGFSPFLAGQGNNSVIVAAARNTYNMVFAINGQTVYEKYLNEGWAVVFAYFRATVFQASTMTSLNFSNPLWDREWQLLFIGVAALHPERYYYYMDLATGSFTGQYVRGGDKLRIVGNVNDVNFTGYLLSETPPFRYTAAGSVTLEFPPILLFNFFFATGEWYFIFQTFLACDGQLVYGIATYIYSPLTSPPNTIPVGVLFELIPISKMIDLGLSTQAENTVGTQSVILDYLGGLVAITAPEITDIYLPVGTPGAVCISVQYNNRNIS
jgi:hypothetical protein